MSVNVDKISADLSLARKAQSLTDVCSSNPLGRIGSLDVRLAQTAAEIAAAQRLRFDVFYNELGARGQSDLTLKDHDQFDAYCDHLIVLDRSIIGSVTDKIIGTYRLMGDDRARKAGGFYSSHEFGVTGLISRHPGRRFLELGRSCVLPAYRSKRTIELLWQGIWAYAQDHKFDVLMGCASFPGTIPAKHAEAMSFLYHHARAQDEWHVAPLEGRHSSMDLMPVEAIKISTAVAALPPLIKGYYRVGSLFGAGAVIDHQFNTTDVMVVLPIEKIAARYKSHYGENAERFAA